jgi:hypothetical protein
MGSTTSALVSIRIDIDIQISGHFFFFGGGAWEEGKVTIIDDIIIKDRCFFGRRR